MFKKDCRCGSSTKNFKNDIGPFFIAECCEKAGYDIYGKTEEDYEKEKDPEAGKIPDTPEIIEKPPFSEKSQEEVDKLNKALENNTPPEGQNPPKIEGDIDKDGDVDKDDVKLAVELEKLGQADLMKLCDEKKITYSKNESKAKLRIKLKA